MARRELDEALRISEERFRTLADNMTQLAWKADSQGSVYWYNKRWYEFTGSTLEESQGEGWKRFQHPDHLPRVMAGIRHSLETGEPWEDTYPLLGRDGEFHWFLTRAVALGDERTGARHWFGTMTDVTKERQAEEALRASERRLMDLNETLEARVVERTAALQRQTRRLRLLANELTEAEQRERKKLAKTLHDGLQQILIAIKMHLPLCAGPNAATAAEKIAPLLNEAILTSRTLAYELSPPVLHDSDLPTALQWLARWFQEKQRLRVNLNVDSDAAAVDESIKIFLFHTVRELLLNAVKHSGAKEAEVSVSTIADGGIRVQVRDRGRGFELGQLETAAEDTRGFGLFSIQERLAAFGGAFEVQSAPGEGAAFSLELPSGKVRDRTGRRSASRAKSRQDSKKKDQAGAYRLLVVDDHEIVRQGLVNLLQEQDDFVVVGEASDGFQAVEQAQALSPDLIVMDINMPRMNGIEATRKIKEMLPFVHIIGLSLHEGQEVQKVMREAGASAYLRKDEPPQGLFDTLRELARKH